MGYLIISRSFFDKFDNQLLTKNSEIARFGSFLECATPTVTREYLSEYLLNLMKNGCRFFMVTRFRLIISLNSQMKMIIIIPACCIHLLQCNIMQKMILYFLRKLQLTLFSKKKV